MALLRQPCRRRVDTGRWRPLQRRLVCRALPEHGVVFGGAGLLVANVKPVSPACACPRSARRTRRAGCPDRRPQPWPFIDQFPRDLRRASRERLPLAVLMVDIDHFKACKRHVRPSEAGDECLRRGARYAKCAAPAPATIWRYGGEEFVVVPPNTDTAGACTAAAVRGSK